MQGAEGFEFQGDNGKAVLLLHGYTGSASEMRPLGEYLHKHGYTVLCPLLPGHGTTVGTVNSFAQISLDILAEV